MGLRALFVSVLTASLVACGASSDDGSANDQDVTNTLDTSVRDQKDTGNCWLFATASWAESLETAALVQQGKAKASDTSTYPAHLSPAYWDYWDWYTKITTGKLRATKEGTLSDELDSGGSWGAAVEIIAKYGMARTNAFLGSGGNKDADVATSALTAMTTSLFSGPLKAASARQDKALVRKQLNAAFGLSADVAKQLDAAFGADGASDFTGGARANTLVLDPGAFTVRLPSPSGAYELLPISEAIGNRASGANPDKRVGAHAWNVTPFKAGTAAENRAYLERVQRALNMGVPLPISWYVASNADPTSDGEYTANPPGVASDADSGGHETLITDYDVDDVPGYGHLAAGKVATEAQKNAALDDKAKITFLRVKNSWGKAGKSVAPKGYNDLYIDYLVEPVTVCPKGAAASSPKCTHEIPLEDVTLPAGF